MTTSVTGHVDRRFSDEEAAAPPWDVVEAMLRDAELFWLTTVRADGRPHVAALVGVWHDGSFWFCTGETEQKRHNLAAHDAVAVTTGVNTWAAGTDVVVEGRAARVTGTEALEPVAAAYYDKYGDDWVFEPGPDGFGHGDSLALVFRVAPAKVIVFAKDPHGQTTYRF